MCYLLLFYNEYWSLGPLLARLWGIGSEKVLRSVRCRTCLSPEKCLKAQKLTLSIAAVISTMERHILELQ